MTYLLSFIGEKVSWKIPTYAIAATTRVVKIYRMSLFTRSVYYAAMDARFFLSNVFSA